MRGPSGIAASVFAPSERRLTTKQERFVEAYVACGGEQGRAAVEAGYPPKSAASQASRLIRNPLIQQAIAKHTLQRIGLRAAAALSTIEHLSGHAKSEYVKLEASKDLLDRAGFRPPERVDHRLDASLTVSFDVAPKVIEGGG